MVEFVQEVPSLSGKYRVANYYNSHSGPVTVFNTEDGGRELVRLPIAVISMSDN